MTTYTLSNLDVQLAVGKAIEYASREMRAESFCYIPRQCGIGRTGNEDHSFLYGTTDN